MAIARKCDICESFFEQAVDRTKTNRIILQNVSANDSALHISTFDICPDCAEAIYDVINQRKEMSQSFAQKS